ncbi:MULTISPECIES: hypothetical protein [Priestia]|uniref:Uncharacterized protein n=2 Tax=Priestia TaxID=2800373 RepID=D5DPN4_PRIM1|nr:MULTISPECIES: hypothetical protein [Priestia]KOP74158.1 hypothetical protein AMS61_07395 [Bacillus sp. FJAT-21351]MCJ7986590.1 hypothetical protein [Priestia sp. OVL9]MDH6655097.1 hypothetical protein [Bacillus sp. PvP124]ADE68955.1 hypothetical protein BMQ_1926 [Priestia megaterium QM B1551]MBA9038751.1 hypothetical protein [Priestia aryabhattai]
MKKYEKMLIAFNDKELNCYANQGEWLYIATKKDTKKGLFRLANYLHYFVSLNSERIPSEFGVVKKIEGYVTAEDLAKLDYESRKQDVSLITDQVLIDYEKFLQKINAQPEHTPMAVTWLEKRFPSNTKELRVHKKFFSGMSKAEKKSIFEFTIRGDSQ